MRAIGKEKRSPKAVAGKVPEGFTGQWRWELASKERKEATGKGHRCDKPAHAGLHLAGSLAFVCGTERGPDLI